MTKKNVIRTSKSVARKASRVLRHSSNMTLKSIGGSALSNRRRTER